MELYEKDLSSFTEIDEEELELGLENGTIEIEVLEPSVSAEEIYHQLQEQGVPVAIKKGIYCKVVKGTFEAINPIPATIRYVKAN